MAYYPSPGAVCAIQGKGASSLAARHQLHNACVHRKIICYLTILTVTVYRIRKSNKQRANIDDSG
jgi:hypothetical protein